MVLLHQATYSKLDFAMFDSNMIEGKQSLAQQNEKILIGIMVCSVPYF